MDTVDIIIDLKTAGEHIRAADGYGENGALLFNGTSRTYNKMGEIINRFIVEAEAAFLKGNQRKVLAMASDLARIELEGCKKYLDEALEDET